MSRDVQEPCTRSVAPSTSRMELQSPCRRENACVSLIRRISRQSPVHTNDVGVVLMVRWPTPLPPLTSTRPGGRTAILFGDEPWWTYVSMLFRLWASHVRYSWVFMCGPASCAPPQDSNGDGGTECVNHTLAKALAKAVDEPQVDWDVHLPLLPMSNSPKTAQ